MPAVWFEGCNLSYTVRGTGPAILLIQGVGVQGDGWTPQVDDLSADFTCVTFVSHAALLNRTLREYLAPYC